VSTTYRMLSLPIVPFILVGKCSLLKKYKETLAQHTASHLLGKAIYC